MNNVISIKAIKNQKCKHSNVLIDEELWCIECSICGEKLDPIHYLHKMAKEETYTVWRLNELKKELKDLEAKLDEKNKCKCTNCGKITKIIK